MFRKIRGFTGAKAKVGLEDYDSHHLATELLFRGCFLKIFVIKKGGGHEGNLWK